MNSLVPSGFRNTAHPIFSSYHRPKYKQKRKLCTDCHDQKHINSDYSRQRLKKYQSNKCSICLCAISDPIVIIHCLHHFCFRCLSKWCEHVNKCPLCNTTKTDFIRNEISSLHKCNNNNTHINVNDSAEKDKSKQPMVGIEDKLSTVNPCVERRNEFDGFQIWHLATPSLSKERINQPNNSNNDGSEIGSRNISTLTVENATSFVSDAEIRMHAEMVHPEKSSYKKFKSSIEQRSKVLSAAIIHYKNLFLS